MKISKIFAGMSALALAAAMSITASANSIKPTNENVADGKENWEPVYGWGDCIDPGAFSGNDVTVTVTFEWTDKASANGATSFKPYFAAGSCDFITAEKLTGKSEFIKVPRLGVDIFENEESFTGMVDADGNEAPYWMQEDGFIVIKDDECTSVTFTITADAIAEMKDLSKVFQNEDPSDYKTPMQWIESTTEGDNANAWDGFNIQTGMNGIIITNVEYSEDVYLNSEAPAEDGDASQATGDESQAQATGGDESQATGDNNGSTDTNTGDNNNGGTTGNNTNNNASNNNTANNTTNNTTNNNTTNPANSSDNAKAGAGAGIALAGVALAGAAFVISKKR